MMPGAPCLASETWDEFSGIALIVDPDSLLHPLNVSCHPERSKLFSDNLH